MLLGADVDLERHARFKASNSVQVAGGLAELFNCAARGLTIGFTAYRESRRTWVERIDSNIGFVMDVLRYPFGTESLWPTGS